MLVISDQCSVHNIFGQNILTKCHIYFSLMKQGLWSFILYEQIKSAFNKVIYFTIYAICM